MAIRTTVFALLFTAALTRPASATSVSLNPIKDNTLIQSTDPLNQLSNGLGDITVGRTNQDGQGPATISIRRSLLQFDFSSIPAGATITGVTLTMRDVMGLNGDPVVSLHQVLASWGEGTSFQAGGMGAPATEGDATWLYRYYDADNSGDAQLWSTPGGDFDPTVVASAVIYEDNGGGQVFSWTGPGLIESVQFFLDNPTDNFGWLLLGDESRGQSAKRFNARDSAFPPVLIVNYVVPEPSGMSLIALALAGLCVLKSKQYRIA